MPLALEVQQTLDNKSALYKEAYRIFMTARETPDIFTIAEQVGIKPDALSAYADRQGWVAKRTQMQTQRGLLETTNRTLAAANVDALAVRKVEAWFGTLAERMDSLIDGIVHLPIDGGPEQDARQKRMQLAESVELANEALKGIAQLIETGRSIGLVLGPKNAPPSEAGKLDFSKLTSLTFVVQQAQKKAGQEPMQVVELGEAPKADGAF